jgi:hypothetical protein
MQIVSPTSTEKFARAIRASKRARWDIDADVIRGRTFDTAKKFLPDGLSLVERLDFLSADEKRFLGQIQGRTYANVFGLVERFINAKVLELSADYLFSDQTALEGLIRFSDEEIKHQELFRRIERMTAETMPAGYTFSPDPNEVAKVVLQKSTWAVLALTLHIELFTQKHYLESIEPDADLSPLYKDVFLYHWKEEAQHAVMDELELLRCDADLSPQDRDRAVDDFIDLVGAVDGILQAQAAADARYFSAACGRALSGEQEAALEAHVLSAYRWQYILSGAEHPRFLQVLTSLITADQAARVMGALATLR